MCCIWFDLGLCVCSSQVLWTLYISFECLNGVYGSVHVVFVLDELVCLGLMCDLGLMRHVCFVSTDT